MTWDELADLLDAWLERNAGKIITIILWLVSAGLAVIALENNGLI